MAKIDLRRINTVRKRLASGAVKTYYYHRDTGTALPGEKGSAEFVAAWLEAERLAPQDTNNLASLIRDFLLSPRFHKNIKTGKPKAEGTKKEYRRIATALEAEFGKMPIKALESPKVRGVFLDYQERIGLDHEREADNRLTVLSLVLSYAADKCRISRNPLARFDRLYSSDRSEIIWTNADIGRFMTGAPLELQQAMILAVHTGQRYGDLIRMRWSDYDGDFIRLKQNKTKARVSIKCTDALKRMLDQMPRVGPFILTRADGRPWHTANDDKALGKAWRAHMAVSGFYPAGWENMSDAQKRECLRFNDLRGTAVTLLAQAGATIPQICAITGHTLQSATQILAKYMAMTEALSSAAIHLFENAPETAFANRLQTTTPPALAGAAKSKGFQ